MSEDPRPIIRVLLVDDDEDDALLTRGLLSDVSAVRFELEWVHTFEEGVERLRQGEHDVALVDWRLGTHDGLELIGALRKDYRQTRIAVMSGGHNGFYPLTFANKLGADLVIAKPIRGMQLIEGIDRLCGFQRPLPN